MHQMIFGEMAECVAAASPVPERQTKALTLISFGFKYGPAAANHVFDVSFLRNPAREPGWHLWSAAGDEMRTWLFEQPAARDFLDRATPLVSMLARVDDDVRVAFGCSGGRHRSAILVEELARRLRADGLEVRVVHREGAAS